MRQLRLQGENLDILLEFLKSNYGKVESTFEKNIGGTLLYVLLSKQHVNWPPLSFGSWTGCCVIYCQEKQDTCGINIYGIGGGRGIYWVGPTGEKRLENRVYSHIQEHAQRLGLKEIQ